MKSEAETNKIPPSRPILAEQKASHHSFTPDVIKALDILNDLSEQLISVPFEEFVQIIPQKACELLSVPICTLWKFDEEKRNFRIIASRGDVNEEYKESELNMKDKSVSYLFEQNKVLALANINKSKYPLSDLEALNQRDWTALLTAPIKIEGRIIGILSVFVKEPYQFGEGQKKVIKRLANYTALSFQKEEISSDRNKLQSLSKTMLDMTEADDSGQLWQLLKRGALELVGSKQVWIGQLDYYTGELKTVAPDKESDKDHEVIFGNGITGKALADEKPIRVKDVTKSPWREIYIPTGVDNRSELAIPILIEKIPIREKTEVKLGSKLIGILDIENPNTNAFSQEDEDRLWLLARYTASRFEKLELDRKLNELREVESELLTRSRTYDYNQILNSVIDSMMEILDFEWVNISLINKERTEIKSEYVKSKGWTEDKINQFKEKARHSLDSNDIQAYIAREIQIEVPEENDERFDHEIFEQFKHENLVRVYIPMIASLSNQVIGTVEVGYNRKYRQYIIEQDVQVLKNFVDYVVHALERKKSAIIDRISHELKSPIIGIRNNASYIQRRLSELSEDKIRIKFDDILMDCDALLYQVKQIEHFMGRSALQKPKIEKTFVFRDIVIKTLNQLKTTIQRDYGFLPPEKIEYDQDSIRKIIVNTDQIKLNQVVYNLLVNSIKYAEKDPKKFRIRLEATEEKTTFTIKFKDWGIGIKEEDKEKIFREGFRSREAIAKEAGLGLGLAISKEIMKRLGGDLILHRLSKPTEFYVILPKN